MNSNVFLRLLPLFLLLLVLDLSFIECSVTYDSKAIVINGQRRILISGSIHYPRSTPDMWEDLILKAKEAGLDAVDTYVFWNVHEPTRRNYNFGGRYDLVNFIKTIHKHGLYAVVRFGPYICAEWSFGGFPVWLRFVSGISFRTDNEPFKFEMQTFISKVVELLTSNNLFEYQGGNIILGQIENEYGVLTNLYGEDGVNYMNWAANMALQMESNIPWLMCKESSAPDPIINSCNGFYCDSFAANKPYKPRIWTEAWTGWFDEYGRARNKRPVEDLAFAVTNFILKEGSFVNYYMFHGGSNFNRQESYFITASYDYDAPLDEFGLIRQPKFGHLKELNSAIKLCEESLVSSSPRIDSLGLLQQAVVYVTESGKCAAFLVNNDLHSSSHVMFGASTYNLPPRSISILPDCKSEVFNTAKVGVQTSVMKMLPASTFFQWTSRAELPLFPDNQTFSLNYLVNQLSATWHQTDYLWSRTSFEIDYDFDQSSLLNQELVVHSNSDALHVFVNEKFSGSSFLTERSRELQFSTLVSLRRGTNFISILSVCNGLPSMGPHFEFRPSGLFSVELQGLNNDEKISLTYNKWTYQVGLNGEHLGLPYENGASLVDWHELASGADQGQEQLRWFKAYFDLPPGDEPLALDMAGMGKGQIWINDVNLGRYFMALALGDCSPCHYAQVYKPFSQCQVGCGQPTQRWYHLPRYFLRPTNNHLVIFEELGGAPSQVLLVRRALSSACTMVSQNHPSINNGWQSSERQQHHHAKPKVHLACLTGSVISAISFASYGRPSGTCGEYQQGSCHAASSLSVLQQKCLWKKTCTATVSDTTFGVDPCPGTLKRLAVDVQCS